MFDLSAQGASLSCPTARGLLHIEFCYILNFPAFPLVLKQKLLWGKRQSNCLSLRAVFCCCVLPENLELQRTQAQLCLSPMLVLCREGSRAGCACGDTVCRWTWQCWGTVGPSQPNNSTSRLAWTCWGLCWLNPSAWGHSPHRHGHRLCWSEFAHSHCWPFLLQAPCPCPALPKPSRSQGIRIPCRIWSRGLAGLWAVPVPSGARAGSLGSSGCSSPLCFPPGNGSLPWLSTLPFHSALMRQWHGTLNNCFVYFRLTRLVLIMYTLTSPVFFIKALIKTWCSNQCQMAAQPRHLQNLSSICTFFFLIFTKMKNWPQSFLSRD